jgi:hypothetical protein
LLAGRSLAAKEAVNSTSPAPALAQNRQTTNFRQQSSEKAAEQAFRSKPKQTLNILNEFQVEQTDHEIRVVDADGSTYSGKLEPLGQTDARSIFNQKQNYAAPSSRATDSFGDKEQPNAEFHFRATGYNSSLKKRVVFEGNYFVSSTAAQKKVEAKAEERDEQTPARITGTAKVRGQSAVQIDAIAVAK